MRKYLEFSDLLGKTFIAVFSDEESITFHEKDGKQYTLAHEQDCCENVYIESIVGDLKDLVNSEILNAEESCNSGENEEGSYTWTFYKLATKKGYIDIRFYGESNGYYSETVSLWTKNDLV